MLSGLLESSLPGGREESARPQIGACVYGVHYAPMVLSFLETWSQWGNVTLISDLGPEIDSELVSAYPKLTVVPLEAKISSSANVRISQKMIFWERLGAALSTETAAIFADIDTVAIGDPMGMLKGDLVLTRREPGSRFFLNTGVVGLSTRALKSDLIREWRALTNRIISTPDLLRQAVSSDHPYGGGDQMAIMQLVNLPGHARFDDLEVSLVDCETYNACGNFVDSRAKVLHLKAALHSYLLNRRPLVGERKVQDSVLQLTAATQANAQGRQRLLDAGVSRLRVGEVYDFRLPMFARDDFTVPKAVEILFKSDAVLRLAAGHVKRFFFIRPSH